MRSRCFLYGRFILALSLMAVSFWASAVAGRAAENGADIASSDILVYASWALTSPDKPPLQNITLVVSRDGVIKTVEEGFIEAGNAEIIDLRGLYVMPGMIDCHVHITSEFTPSYTLEQARRTEADRALDASVFAARTLNAGFTTIADLGGGPEVFSLRDAINAGKIQGPRIIASGQAITPSGGHGDVMSYRREINALLRGMRGYRTCNGPYECRAAVREAVRSGADIIKITATGGALTADNTGLDQQLFDDELVEIVKTARALGRKTAAHAHGARGANAAVAAGVSSIEHGTFLSDRSLDRMRKDNIYLAPTLLASATINDDAERFSWLSPIVRGKVAEVAARASDTVRRAHAKGVKIVLGTDSGISTHGANAKELALLVEAGLTPRDALSSATIHAADHLGLGGKVGTLSSGGYADIIAMPENPLKDVRAAENVVFVMKGGVVAKPLGGKPHGE